MERSVSVFIVIVATLSLCALVVQAQSGSNSTAGSGSNSTTGSGSGSGDTGGIPANCSSLPCSHNCSETEDGPVCSCPIGYRLDQDMVTCESCPGGYYGMGCSNMCNCSSGGNPCDAITGDCECNSCYSGDMCEVVEGYDCFVQFLGIADKSEENLQSLYGSQAYPVPPSDRNLALVSNGILQTTSGLVMGVMFDVVDRSAVQQGPLLKLSWTIDKTINRPEADRVLEDLSDRVKVGAIRATYIVQDSPDEAVVTINAGVREQN